ncbi:MAG: hypothetical protein M1826_007139 [Phylliscum demangeonii]|nr:MAG: hypothetical protein M1826_007139 [Phylliscum demangeonii]
MLLKLFPLLLAGIQSALAIPASHAPSQQFLAPLRQQSLSGSVAHHDAIREITGPLSVDQLSQREMLTTQPKAHLGRLEKRSPTDKKKPLDDDVAYERGICACLKKENFESKHGWPISKEKHLLNLKPWRDACEQEKYPDHKIEDMNAYTESESTAACVCAMRNQYLEDFLHRMPAHVFRAKEENLKVICRERVREAAKWRNERRRQTEQAQKSTVREIGATIRSESKTERPLMHHAPTWRIPGLSALHRWHPAQSVGMGLRRLEKEASTMWRTEKGWTPIPE